ncbi:hypothetical protein OROHE_020592, partial [Orobanche hederae]
MYFSAADRAEMMSMFYNWPAEQGVQIIAVCLMVTTGDLIRSIYHVDMIVVTDGAGFQGIGTAIRKLDLYVAAAGKNPQRVILR